ncbi:hypothetical protein [Merismopedia glauca]|uniref:Uncharacterized protein n=1 Tax=Merismopedia glauca CCAP 1448/3 TaxID=1296344 RepID=A0A2T1C4I8_9CYAN|nr:hypothetical protein [Merismopedia glauca]PSB03195.1 hypothetical protein C7B64_09605 [Merismopedia glauca CCAP 1448/3]
MSLIKGIKQGKTIKLLEEVNVPDGQEILIDIQTSSSFWTSLEKFRNSPSFKDIDFDEEILTDLRDKTIGRNVEGLKFSIFKDGTGM